MPKNNNKTPNAMNVLLLYDSLTSVPKILICYKSPTILLVILHSMTVRSIAEDIIYLSHRP